ncbi:GGDEF domain-containing protein [Aquirhabdus parva]|uniref:diguanylate cyclase n=1 Tax=Aquirhabdus parva TaxID=2283318 RepID=A0A345P8B5_9GAMM|nr:GGDEF domain-containing protein [Aquirhabdus parva]
MVAQALTLKKIRQHIRDIRQKNLSSLIIIEWSFIQKSILLLAIMVVLFTSYALYVAFVMLHPTLHHFINVNSTILLWKDVVILMIAFAAMIFGYTWRTSARVNRYFPIFCIIFFATAMCISGYCLGVLSPATGVFVIGTPLIGLVLFPRKIVLIMAVLTMLTMVLLTIASNLNVIPYAPLFTHQDLVGMQGFASFYLYSQLYFTLPPLLFILFIMDVILRQWSQRERDAAMQSKLDSLTHLLSRYSIDQHLERLVTLSSDQKEISTLLIAIDRIEYIQKTYGRTFCNELKKKIAKLLQLSLRNQDLAGSFDDDHFIVILSAAHREVGLAVAERIRVRIENLIIADGFGLEIQITASIGVSTCLPFGMVGADSILIQAEQALAQAQQNGTNLVMHYDQVPIAALKESDVVFTS